MKSSVIIRNETCQLREEYVKMHSSIPLLWTCLQCALYICSSDKLNIWWRNKQVVRHCRKSSMSNHRLCMSETSAKSFSNKNVILVPIKPHAEGIHAPEALSESANFPPVYNLKKCTELLSRF